MYPTTWTLHLKGRDSVIGMGYARQGKVSTEADMAKHEHGSMDTTAQEKTFAGFLRLAAWVVGISIGVLIFLALVNA